ncbi:hornerin-like [Cucumis melo var. makuwa]|uniref:Hornerin-like n=1 Tax=Cucumis melo var. makuwa TaxID=1194695 RepID=A0A5A7TK33_CUCMM|nr:hornerin-like [Cucumis melo var. makuwa]TYK09731.1 hornerin-like [Cucumis melo var. makuwa]
MGIKIERLALRRNWKESCHYVLVDDAGRIRTGCKVLPKEIGRPERAEPSDPKKAYEIERLKKLGATVFQGSTDPADVENWLNMLEKCFDVMNCPEERKWLSMRGSIPSFHGMLTLLWLLRVTGTKGLKEGCVLKYIPQLQPLLSGRIFLTSGFRGCEQRRFTPGINISSRQDFKSRSRGQASSNVSYGSVFQRHSQRIPSQPTRSTIRLQPGQESIASTVRRTPCTSYGKNDREGTSGVRQKGVVGRTRQQGNVDAMPQQEAEDAPDVITGTILICNVPANVLFDPGATHSFVSSIFLTKLNRMLEPLSEELAIYNQVGDVLLVNEVLRNCEVLVEGISMLVDLMPLELQRLDVILGMDFLFAHYASMGCHRKEVVFRKPGLAEVVFRDDLSILPPDREIEFTIELLPGTTPIS